MRPGRFSVFAGIGLVTPLAAAGTISFSDQLRSIESHTEVASSETSDADNQTKMAPDFSPFTETVDVTSSLTVGPDTIAAFADAAQNSTLAADGIDADGMAHAATDPTVSGVDPSGSGNSYISLTFEVDADTPFLLSGALSISAIAGDGYGAVGFYFLGPGGVPVLEAFIDEESTEPLAAGGILVAGEYTLDVFASAYADTSDDAAVASFDFALSLIPEPASGLLALLGGVLLRRRR